MLTGHSRALLHLSDMDIKTTININGPALYLLGQPPFKNVDCSCPKSLQGLKLLLALLSLVFFEDLLCTSSFKSKGKTDLVPAPSCEMHEEIGDCGNEVSLTKSRSRDIPTLMPEPLAQP